VANADSYTVAENTTNTFSVTTNDVVRTVGGYLTITGVTMTNGIATIVNSTNIQFAPTNGLGTGTVGYTLIDNVGGTSTGLLTVSFTNNPPVANADSYTVAENTTNTFFVTTNDVVRTVGGYLTITAVTMTNGIATIVNSTNIQFAPTNGLGTGTVGYTLIDNVGGTSTGLLTVSFTNNPPVANADSYTVAENTTNTFFVTTNDVVRTVGGYLTITVTMTNGIATIVNSTNIQFAPTNGLGTGTVGYTLIDNVGGTSTGLLTVSFTNNPPVANADSYTVAENTTNTFFVTTNDVVRTVGGYLTITGVTMTNGIATIVNSTNIQFAPTNGLGTGTVGYTLIDNVGGTSTGLLTVSFTNNPPVANADSYTVAENTTNTFFVTTNDVVRTVGGRLTITG
jgi:general stress protein CsbA